MICAIAYMAAGLAFAVWLRWIASSTSEQEANK